ncbi:MAG: thiamine biosynthesis protein ThiF [Acidobacteria bacterium]|nr:MAG: thiamine biosynthesis protein ThiF [Acidobacteriota bacterium]
MKIKINGKATSTDSSSLFQLMSERRIAPDNLIVILNGFQTPEDLPVHDGDEVVFIEKGKMPDRTEFEAMMSARHTPHIYEKLKQARVALAGLGGLGSTIAVALARTGVGKLHLVDFDVVEPSNLNRQQYKIKHLGMKKTEALKMELEEINPFITVLIDTAKIAEDNIPHLFAEDDIVCEAFDQPDAKAMLVNGLREHFPNKKIVAASGLAGYESGNFIATKRLMKNLYLCGDGTTEARIGRGLMAPRVSICAGHQANMVLRLIMGMEDA